MTAVTAAAQADSLEAIRDSVTRSPHAMASASVPTATEPTGDVRAILVGDSVALSLFAAFQPESTPV